MEAKREQVAVGSLVLIAAGLLVIAVFTMSGAFGGGVKTYRAYFPFAGGIEPGATVRYAGGPKAGRVEQLRIDPQDPALIEITFTVRSEFPVKTDSHVKIMSSSPLGDNHLEIFPGSSQAGDAATGSLLPAEPYLDFNALASRINEIAPQAEQLLKTLNDRSTELKTTVERINDLMSEQNRANLSAALSNTSGLLQENRPQIQATLRHIRDASQRLGPLLENLNKTSEQANRSLDHIDAMLGENRSDLRQSVAELRKLLLSVNELTGRIDQTMDVNSENIDDVIENLNHITENLKEFTDTIKGRPDSLIRTGNPREHQPGDLQ
jgi:phospholipid/cholesterol/gamma-HCH transport system substrate-binding protein